MHWYTCKSLLNTLGRAVEQLAGCLAKQAKVSSRGQSTTAMFLGGAWGRGYGISLVPRPHPLTRRNGLVNQVEFLGLAQAFATL